MSSWTRACCGEIKFLREDEGLSLLVKYELLSTSAPSDLIGPDRQGSAAQPGGGAGQGDTGQM